MFFGLLGVYNGFGGCSCVLVDFLGFYNCFRGQEIETTVKTKKARKPEFDKYFVFLVCVDTGCGGFTWLLKIVLFFYNSFRGQELETTVKA